MSVPSAYEQYLLELINAERAKAGAQPLAFDGDLNEAAEGHSSWMISSDRFSHAGSGGSSPGDRISSAGYSFSGSWGYGENIAWTTLSSPSAYTDEVHRLHNMLMNSAGHKANILNPSFKEVGLGMEVGNFSGYQAAVLTENFALSGYKPFLTGVAYDDADGDLRYDVGEGLGGIKVSAASSSGQVYSTTTMSSGGYQLELPSGSYTVTFSATGKESVLEQIRVVDRNIKVDLVDPEDIETANQPSAGDDVMTGTAGADLIKALAGVDLVYGLAGNDTLWAGSGSDTLRGDSGRDVLRGEGGDDLLLGGADDDQLFGGSNSDKLHGDDGTDVLVGNAGIDRLYGGAGNDKLYGGKDADFLDGGGGGDLLYGQLGSDKFLFSGEPSPSAGVDRIADFELGQDAIWLSAAAFKNVGPTGTLADGAFHIGAAAQDAGDRIIYNSETGGLSYDADGTGGSAPVAFAVVSQDLGLASDDFLIV